MIQAKQTVSEVRSICPTQHGVLMSPQIWSPLTPSFSVKMAFLWSLCSSLSKHFHLRAWLLPAESEGGDRGAQTSEEADLCTVVQEKWDKGLGVEQKAQRSLSSQVLPAGEDKLGESACFFH